MMSHVDIQRFVVTSNIDDLEKHFNERKELNGVNEFLQNEVDAALRKRVVDIVKSGSVDELRTLIAFAFQTLNKGFCTRPTPLQCMADAFDFSNVANCEKYFAIVEENQEALKKLDTVPMLRTCNDLLKRLSRATNATFCGRILFFLSRFLALSEKSGLNITGQFNTTNETFFENLLADAQSGSKSDEKESTRESVDPAFYTNFWKMQSFFCNPHKCFEKLEWGNFRQCLHEVLIYFASHKLEKGSKHRKRRKEQGWFDEPDLYFAKYLTSTKLFALQIADSQFRRSFLVQTLIILQYLLADVKFKASKKEAILTEDQQRFVTEMQEKCYRLLRETYPNGQHFSDSLKKILQREEEWSKWKNNGCQDYSSRRILAPMRKFAKRPPPPISDTLDLGNADLNKLWKGNDVSLLEFCQQPQRDFTPLLKNFLQDPLDEGDPDQQVEEQYKSIYDSGFQWRCSRLLSSQAKEYLSSSITQKHYDSIPKFLDNVIVKTAHEIPELHEQLENRERIQRDRLLQSMKSRLKQEPKDDQESAPFLDEQQLKKLCDELSSKWTELATALDLTNEMQTKLMDNKKNPDFCVQELILQWSEIQAENNAGSCIPDLLQFLREHELLTDNIENILKGTCENGASKAVMEE
ncbi:unnamed protein product, partial [Mesorhabditis belari]|uniref:THO complex subunit 1 n=1 Tax=Mesorhabditis belari TaxID=2138241 RepID=A0AAF3F2G3_9BILA